MTRPPTQAATGTGLRAGGEVTSRDVARRAGVSQPTVSRALRDDPRVSSATKSRVEQAARELGYVPSVLGRSLSTRRTGQVAMVADLDKPLYPLLVPPIHDELQRQGYRMVLVAERGDEAAMHERLLDRSVDGVVLTTTLLHSILAGMLRDRGTPFVFLNRVSNVVEGDSSTADNSGGAARAAGLLAGLGHRRVGALLGPSDTSTGRDREAGFRAALEAAGLALEPPYLARGDFTYRHGYDGLHAVLAASPPPTALLCSSDVMAIGALNAALELGVRVPEDLALVGFDDLEMAAWPAFRLTTVHVPMDVMARTAVTLLVERLANTAAPAARHEVLATSVVLRDTHAPTHKVAGPGATGS